MSDGKKCKRSQFDETVIGKKDRARVSETKQVILGIEASS